jgi:hypothetical protein
MEVFPRFFHGHGKLLPQKPLDNQYQHNLSRCIEKTDSLLQEINPIIQNCDRLDSERHAIETKIKEVRTQAIEINKSSDNSAKLIESLHQLLASMFKLLDEIKRKPVTGPTLISLDSKYLWKANFHVLINNGRTIQSEPVQTSQSGYRMELNSDINTDEQNKKQYLTVSFAILPGDFDAILSWPFMFPIMLSIMDLTPAKKNIVHSISQESQKAALGRPLSNAKSSYSITKFCLVDVLLANGSNYIQDGCMFVEAHIDFTAPGVNPIISKAALRTTDDYIQTNTLASMS